MATLEEVIGTDIAHKSDYLRSATGDLDTITGLENMKWALFHRMVTATGELLHRPGYGVGIQDFRNAPSTIETQRQIALRIKSQFELDPRVQSVNGVSFQSTDTEPEKLVIIVRVTIKGYDELTARFMPFGDGGIT